MRLLIRNYYPDQDYFDCLNLETGYTVLLDLGDSNFTGIYYSDGPHQFDEEKTALAGGRGEDTSEGDDADGDQVT